jgi:hypothetical protein
VLATWEPYALMAVGILSGLFGQSAFNAGTLTPRMDGGFQIQHRAGDEHKG